MEKNFTAILFDMDGVLVDSMGNYAQAWTRACNQVGIEVDEEEMYRREGEQDEKSAKYFVKSAGLMLTKARVKEIIRLKDEFFAGAPAPKLFPGAFEVVSAFAKANHRIGIVTGSNRPEFTRLIPPSIRDLVEVSICGDEVLHGKPNPEPYLKAIMALGVKPQETAVIENAPYGIQAARGAGAHVVAVLSYLGDEDLTGAHNMVDDIRDLPALFGLDK